MHKRKLYCYLPNLLITIVLSFAILAFVLAFEIKSVVMNPRTYTEAMYANSVDVTAFDEINSYFDRQAAYTGINPDVFKNSVQQKDVSAAMFAYVDSTFEYISGKTSKLPEFEFKFTTLEENIHNDYVRWAKENKVEFNDELKKYEKRTVANAESVILNKLDIMLLSHLNGENGISTKIQSVYGKINNAMYIVLGLCIVLLAVIFVINRKHIRNAFYWSSVSFLSAGIIMIIPSAIMICTKYFDGLVLQNDAIYSALTQSLYAITKDILLGGIVLLAVFALLMFLYIALYKNMFKFKYKK